MNFTGMLGSGLTEYWEVAPGISGLRTLFVNVAFIELKNREWLLVDTGLGMYAGSIRELARERFGTAPLGIILTHGHFDHVGGIQELLQEWDIPVYAHPLELPYLTGQADYPPADPAVGGGLMSMAAPLYPYRGINLGSRVVPLPEDGSIPGTEEWRWVHSPGHTPGHISLFRGKDRVLIAGDAFLTVKQESAFHVIKQDEEVHGPPAYFTTDWEEAEQSVRNLGLLNPQIVFCGHGAPMQGKELSHQLAHLCRYFKELAVPGQGKYV